ncbi:MAG: hypothetical protein JW959_06750 [Pirellulales bacterium]|nr:hypothetical protein [Pirellulales bacterium]
MDILKRLLITAAVTTIVAVLVVGGLLYFGQKPPPGPPPPREELPEALVVYCMHDDQRDQYCRTIEEYTHQVLEKSFSAELKNENLVWLVINYEHPNNSFVVEEYDIEKPTIVVVDGRPAKGRAWKNHHRKIWELIEDENAFKEYMRKEIEKALKDVPSSKDRSERGK